MVVAFRLYVYVLMSCVSFDLVGTRSGGVSVPGGVRGGWGEGGGGSNANNHASVPPPPPNGEPAGSGGGGGGMGREGDAGGGSRARSGGFVGRTGGGDADGGYEGKLVEEICVAGGTKSTPSKVLRSTNYGLFQR